jgi:G3E family GTPase
MPVSVVTGLLGSGKTTLLNGLLRHGPMRRSVVIVNEFGPVCLDHPLYASIKDEVFVMRSGCRCCTLRDDLADALGALVDRRPGAVPAAFDRVIFETTGLADPGPIIQTLMCHPMVNGLFRLDGVVTVVDAANGHRQRDRQPVWAKQVAMADRLVLTKTDRADGACVQGLSRQLRRLNPRAPLIRAVRGAVAPGQLLGIDPFDAGTIGGADGDLAMPEPVGAIAPAVGYDRHEAGIRNFALEAEAPLDWRLAREWLGDLIGCYGEDLLRVKGLLNLAGADVPIVIHGVQHLFHEPIPLPAWPGGERRTRMVFVVRDIARTEIEPGFRACLVGDPADSTVFTLP